MNINWISPITHQTSYGLTSINIITALDALGHNISLFPIGGIQLDQGCNWTHQPIIKSLDNGKLNYEVNAPCIRLYHQFSQSEFVGHGPHIAFPIFELNHFTVLEKAQLSRVENVITCSEWGKFVVENEINKTCKIVPLGYDPRVFEPTMKSEIGGTTKFLLLGKTEVRKSSREIIECFSKAFNKEDNVELWVSWQNIFNSPQEQAEWDRFAQSGPIGNKIKILPRLSSCLEVANVIKSCDCLVSLSKAEGWNLPALEALACSKHVIATNNTAQTEFLNSRNSLLIETPELENAWDGVWFKGEGFDYEKGKWHSIGKEQKEQCICYMRDIHKLKQNNELILNDGALETAKKFTWKNSAEKLVEVLESL